jgi:hypothetical protein
MGPESSDDRIAVGGGVAVAGGPPGPLDETVVRHSQPPRSVQDTVS